MGKEEQPQIRPQADKRVGLAKMRAGRWWEFPVMLENQQKCLSPISASNSSFARFSHDRKGRVEAYFCLINKNHLFYSSPVVFIKRLIQ
ncbi:MAG: hypothetical protein GXO24_06225 [Chlorobi bacterium]|nr:hypothetical protein [Chlorobiota bacterium]